MPNDCFNKLIFDKSFSSIFVEKYIGKDDDGSNAFDFGLIEPIGEVTDKSEERFKKWGTRKIGYDLSIEDNIVKFCSSNSPPIQIIKKLAEIHKGIEFHLEYFEPNVGFRGTLTAKWQNNEVMCIEDYWDMKKEDYEELGLIE
jgi:hypothetical protein